MDPLRLDWVSPLPPVASGIADYSADLLPHLAALADVRVVALPGQPVAPEIAERFRPVAAAETGSDGRLPLYQMGNNRHHEPVLALAEERPGVVLLHDLFLHHLLAERTLVRGDVDGYAAALAADHGWVGEEAARPRRWGAGSDAAFFALPAHRALLRSQRGVIVHSLWAAARIAEDDPDLAVRVVPMGVPLPAPAPAGAAAALRARLGIPAGRPLLGSFGFQTRIKRTLTALAALSRPELSAAHLLIVGEVSPELDYAAEAQRLGVAARVTVTGYVDYPTFTAAIAAADLCLNLRHPTAGETSASLLRVLAAGRPAVVSDYAQFAELPEAVAARVAVAGEEGEEAAALARVAGVLLAAPERLSAMGAAARELVAREHDPGRAAAALVAACRELSALAPPGPSPARPAPPTTLTWGRLAGSLGVEGAEPPWPEGTRRTLRLVARNDGPAVWLAAGRGTGGVAFAVRLLGERGDLLAGRPWLPLPVDVAPGEEAAVEVAVRRPPGPARLVVEPQVVGVGSFPQLGGPIWEGEL
jgi:glycosyltransferase involved in cell wall biosynthesis